MRTKNLVKIAMYIALFIVLEWAASVVPLFKMPNGGSLGLGTIALLLASYDLGIGYGVAIGILTIPLQFIYSSLYFLNFIQFALDYVLAFGIYGIACGIPNFKVKRIPILTGVVVTNGLRLVFSTLSGMWYWGVPFWGSLVYNATYLIPTAILGLILVPILYRAISRGSSKEVSI